MKNDPRQILADNVAKLMRDHPHLSSQEKIAKKAQKPGGKKVAQTSVGYLLRPNSSISPKLDTITAVAEVFGLDPWRLLHPALGDKDVKTPKQAQPQLLDEELMQKCIGIVERHLKQAKMPKSSSAWSIKNIMKLAIFEYNRAMERGGSSDVHETRKQARM